MRVVVVEFVSLDGVMQAPGDAEEFEYGGWQLPFIDEDQVTYIRERLFAADALLLGRKTYQGFASAWSSRTNEEGFGLADRMNSLPKFVASKTLAKAEWNATLIKENIVEAVAELKQQPGQELLIFGSADLVHTLRQHNLIDEYQLRFHPIVLGSGKRLFNGGIDMTALKLANTKTTSTGVVILTYQPDKNKPK